MERSVVVYRLQARAERRPDRLKSLFIKTQPDLGGRSTVLQARLTQIHTNNETVQDEKLIYMCHRSKYR